MKFFLTKIHILFVGYYIGWVLLFRRRRTANAAFQSVNSIAKLSQHDRDLALHAVWDVLAPYAAYADKQPSIEYLIHDAPTYPPPTIKKDDLDNALSLIQMGVGKVQEFISMGFLTMILALLLPVLVANMAWDFWHRPEHVFTQQYPPEPPLRDEDIAKYKQFCETKPGGCTIQELVEDSRLLHIELEKCGQHIIGVACRRAEAAQHLHVPRRTVRDPDTGVLLRKEFWGNTIEKVPE